MAEHERVLATRPPDVRRALADEPPPHLVEPLGQPSHSPAGRAVWCHYALAIEAALDRAERQSPSWAGWSNEKRRARQVIAIACQLRFAIGA
jgi:hypothetical protein